MRHTIRKHVAAILLGLLLWTPVAMAADYSVAVVQLADPTFTANMYEGASTSSGVVSTLRNGTGVRVYSRDTVWSEVSVGDTRGYVLSEHLCANAEATKNTSSYTDGYVSSGSENGSVAMYNDTTTTNSIIAYFPKNTYAKVFFTEGRYSYVEINGQFGYVLTAHLALEKEDIIIPAPSPTGNAVVANMNPNHKLNLREGPSTSTKSLGMYPQGTRVTVVERGATWSKVEVSGKSGYMYSANLKFD